MNILFVAPELYGLAQVGGVADVMLALPAALRSLGHDVRIVIPYYQQIARRHIAEVCIPSLKVPMGNCDVWCAVHSVPLERATGLPVYAIEHNGFFDRPSLYDDGLLSYLDNADRFAFLSKAALQVCKSIGFRPQIVNANDWTTALAPFFLRVHERDGFFRETASVLSIHNTFYQGKFYGDKRSFIGIPDEYFTADIIEDQHGVNFLKAGIYFADQINAVSPSYAAELLTQAGSHGLCHYFQRREKDLRGILNGCDYGYWNPQIDPILPANYGVNSMSGKRLCKREMLKQFQLSGVSEEMPLFGMVCRLTSDKGFAYLIPALYDVLQKEKIGVAILGTGDPSIEQNLHHLVQSFPGRISFRGVFDESLAHHIYAGSDFFLMPSLFEACGSCQMYSMAYGTLPLVRSVGGLIDTVEDLDEQTGNGTGFVFTQPTVEDLLLCIRRAMDTYSQRQPLMRHLIKLAMSKEYRWEDAAKRYLDMYEVALIKRKQNETGQTPMERNANAQGITGCSYQSRSPGGIEGFF